MKPYILHIFYSFIIYYILQHYIPALFQVIGMYATDLTKITQELGGKASFLRQMLSGVPNFQPSIIPTVREHYGISVRAGSSEFFSLNIDIQFPIYFMILCCISPDPGQRTDPAYTQPAKRCVQLPKHYLYIQRGPVYDSVKMVLPSLNLKNPVKSGNSTLASPFLFPHICPLPSLKGKGNFYFHKEPLSQALIVLKD